VTSLPSELEPRRTGGRPSRLTRETHDAIVTAIEAGSYVKIAAQAAGVGQSTLAGWLARGREAASARDRHDPDRRYCPSCDRDRTDEVEQVDEHNAEASLQHGEAVEAYNAAGVLLDAPEGTVRPEPPAEPAYAVLDRCPTPTCRTDEPPRRWELPPEEAPYLELLESVTRAQAEAEVAAVSAWRSAWSQDWRAARDYLARTSPERWAGVTRVQMTTEEAERRIDDAVNEALLAVGIDLPGADDPLDAALDEGLDP
jgi:hypothetical protein